MELLDCLECGCAIKVVDGDRRVICQECNTVFGVVVDEFSAMHLEYDG